MADASRNGPVDVRNMILKTWERGDDMKGLEGESATRQMVQIDGENYYIVVGESFVMATVPRENTPAMSKTREIVETICGAITAVMENKQVNNEDSNN